MSNVNECRSAFQAEKNSPIMLRNFKIAGKDVCSRRFRNRSVCDVDVEVWPCVQGSYVLNNFIERLSGRRLYERLHQVLLDTGALHALKAVDDTDWPNTPSLPQVSTQRNVKRNGAY